MDELREELAQTDRALKHAMDIIDSSIQMIKEKDDRIKTLEEKISLVQDDVIKLLKLHQ